MISMEFLFATGIGFVGSIVFRVAATRKLGP